MVAEIGILIAVYVFTRMLALFTRTDEHVIARVFAVFTMIVAALIGLGLLLRGVSSTSGLTQ